MIGTCLRSLVFAEGKCATPCPRFVPGAEDENGMIACANCDMWFLDDDPTVEAYESGKNE